MNNFITYDLYLITLSRINHVGTYPPTYKSRCKNSFSNLFCRLCMIYVFRCTLKVIRTQRTHVCIVHNVTHYINLILFFWFLKSLRKLATVSSIRIRRPFSRREKSAIDRCIIYCAASACSIGDRVARKAQLARRKKEEE